MPKLHEIVALVTGRKTEAQKKLTELHRVTEKPDLFKGMTRVYRPDQDDDTEMLPPEGKLVQTNSTDVLLDLENTLVNVYDLVATQDAGNTTAKADVVTTDGVTILTQVPVTTLLYLEKQLDDLKKFYATMPVLDPALEWTRDENANIFKSVSVTNRAKRKKVPLELSKATDKHPAQVQLIEEEFNVGKWTKTEMSSALTAKQKKALLERVAKLKEAVVIAREKANENETKSVKAGEVIFKFLHAGLV
jgi:hypothetical protein